MQVRLNTLAQAAGFAVAAGFSAAAFAGGNNGTICPKPVGPDVIVGDILSLPSNYAAEQIPAGSGNYYDAFSFGTSSCNVGNQNVQWNAFPANTHPAIGQNLFKLKNGRFEQIGMSWLKHGFTALTQNICGCGCNGQGGPQLGVGCSDPYTASRNGSQGGLGPRWQVNADTGFYPTGGPANPPWSGSTARRLRVKSTDLEPTSPTVAYFAECQYVTQDDAANGNQNNNASWRPVTIAGGPNEFTVTVVSATQREQAGISAWKKNMPAVTLTNVQVENEGLFIVGALATDLGNGIWHYEFAVQNLNSDYSGAGFSIPLPPGTVVTNVGFHDVEYHSWDGQGSMNDSTKVNFDGSDWIATEGSDSVSWNTNQTFVQNPNANALRWGTLYNFRFDADAPPESGGTGTLTTFKTVTTQQFATVVPGVDCNNNNVADSVEIANGTVPDVDGNGIPDECQKPTNCVADPTGNQVVDVDDLLVVINNWGNPGLGDLNTSGTTDVDDLTLVINNWGVCQ